MAVAYIEKYDGYIADTPNLDFERCDGTAFSYYEVNSSDFNDTLNFLTINGGQGTSPLAYVPTDRTTEFSFESSQFTIDMFAMSHAEKIIDGDFGTRETAKFVVYKDTNDSNKLKLKIPYEVQANSVRIRGLEEADTAAAGKFKVEISPYTAVTYTGAGVYTVTLGGTLAEGDVITVAGTTITLDATSGASTAAAVSAINTALAANSAVTDVYTLSGESPSIVFTEKSGHYGAGQPAVNIISESGTISMAITTAPATTSTTADGGAATIVTFANGEVVEDEEIRVSYVRRVVDAHQIVVTTTSSTAKGELWAHYPVYSSGTDCTDASIKGWVHFHIPRVRVTQLPNFSTSYKSAATNGVTFSAIDAKLASRKYFDITYEPTDANGDIVTETENATVTFR